MEITSLLSPLFFLLKPSFSSISLYTMFSGCHPSDPLQAPLCTEGLELCAVSRHTQQYKAKGTTFNLLHSQDNSHWKGLLEVSSPPSKQG